MPERDLEDFLILRAMDEPITEDDLEAAGDRSGDALEDLRNEGADIRWIESEVMTNEDGDITGTYCHYRAESEEVVREHADRAELPVTRIDRRGHPLEGE
ncbi:DUF4242 domain-containing protein [Haloterrigena alkaliphila]|uniref:DUF4242 domain-containing protein n=1 Tax=Haloterrigena alkaliphila TaxID=2816475 RepID=A0A8A2VDD8_9EURY|nr:DUF4242 domain-containing protein [Haloterrigena alkaliphila]QSW98255.1 DUF4242 domain-containing protein [Haloterrigena alkaliphila]